MKRSQSFIQLLLDISRNRIKPCLLENAANMGYNIGVTERRGSKKEGNQNGNISFTSGRGQEKQR